MVAIKASKQEKCWQTTSTLTCCSCCNLQCCGFLLLPLIIMWSHPAPKWILREADVSRIQLRLAWVTSPWNVDVAKFDLSWEGYPVRQTGLPTLKGHPTKHVNVIKLKWEIIWRGGLPPKWVTMPTWGPPPPCKQALKVSPAPFLQIQQLNDSPFIIWVNLVPLESHFYDLISCYYFWTLDASGPNVEASW